MRMPCVCQRTLSAASAVSSRFDRALLAACRRPPTNALSTIRSRRARRTEPRSATHICAQGVARARGRAHQCRRSMRPCVCSSRSLTHSGGGERGRVSTPVGVLDAPEAGDAIGRSMVRSSPCGPVPRPVPSAPWRAHVSACAAQERSE